MRSRFKPILGACIIEQSCLDDIKTALRDYPKLSLQKTEEGQPFIVGEWDVAFNDEVFETYEIQITFEEDYPKSLPKVYEISNKIEHCGDMHFNYPDWHACLFVSHQRWEVWPIGSPFKQFLEIPVHNFFLGQAHRAALGYWPRKRERGHGDDGIIEYYQEKFECDNSKVIYDLLLTTSEGYKKPCLCPCNSTTPFSECHKDIVGLLAEKQEPEFLSQAIEIFRGRINSEV